jgi:hypothetical protein
MKDKASVALSTTGDEKTRDRTAARAQIFSRLLIVFFLGLFTVVALGTIKNQSPTIDEPLHLLAGYSYLKWGDYRVNPEHPPLAKMFGALPLLALDVKDPRPSAPEWDKIHEQRPGLPATQVAAEMFFVQNDAEAFFFYGKLPFVFLALILGLFIFFWAEEWFGPVAAAASLVLFFTNPNIIAHSTVVHTDLAFTTFFFLGTYFFQRTLRSGGWLNVCLTCVLFGMATITKFSAVAIFISWTLIGLVWLLNEKLRWGGDGARTFTRPGKLIFLATVLVAMTLTAFGFIWAAYGFRFDAMPAGNAQWSYAQVMSPDSPAFLQRLVSLVSQFRLLPDAWIYGQLYNVTYLRRTAFLLGDFSGNGFWLYFPVALLVKTPLPALVLIALAGMNLFTLRRSDKMERAILWIPVLVYSTLAIWARMNIGVRHILPLFPFLFVLAGESAAGLWASRARWKKSFLILLAVWAFWNLIGTYPNYLSFFNEAAGGSKNGHKILVDSNLDWGQDLKGLKTWMDGRGIKKIFLLYFGTAEPVYYGIDAVRFPGGILSPRLAMRRAPEVPYTLAVSANYFYAAQIYATPAEALALESLRLKKPDAVVGGSILIFNLDPSDPQVNLSLGRIMALRGEWAAAEALLQRVLSSPEFAGAAREILAQLRARQGKSAALPNQQNQAGDVQLLPKGTTRSR